MSTKKKKKDNPTIEKLKERGYRLYEKKWVEQEATKGFEAMMASMRKKEPEYAKAMEKALWVFEVVYYTAFENALNTLFMQVLKDEFTKVELIMDEFHKLVADITHDKKDGLA